MDFFDWRPTSDHNVEILNETVDLYRYYGLTLQAQFLYECVEDTIERIIQEELDYLEKHDRMRLFINRYFPLPDTDIDLLIKSLDQNNGRLSKKIKQKEFDEFTDEEIAKIEDTLSKIF